MDAWNVVECRAKEALGTLSLIDNNNNWEAPYEKPPKLLTRRVLNTDRTNDKGYRIRSSRKHSRR